MSQAVIESILKEERLFPPPQNLRKKLISKVSPIIKNYTIMPKLSQKNFGQNWQKRNYIGFANGIRY